VSWQVTQHLTWRALEVLVGSPFVPKGTVILPYIHIDGTPTGQDLNITCEDGKYKYQENDREYEVLEDNTVIACFPGFSYVCIHTD
jgi:hypothetical protein